MEAILTDGRVGCPVLQVDNAWMPPPSEATQVWVGYQGRPVERRVPQLVLVVPFTGEHEVFLLTASTYNMNPPQVARPDRQELHLAIESSDPNPDVVRAQFDSVIGKIEQHPTPAAVAGTSARCG